MDPTSMDPTSPPTAQTRSNKATVALVLAIASVLAGPPLLMAQIIALFGLATVSEEPSNPIGYTLVILAIFVLLALLTFALPITVPLARRGLRGPRARPRRAVASRDQSIVRHAPGRRDRSGGAGARRRRDRRPVRRCAFHYSARKWTLQPRHLPIAPASRRKASGDRLLAQRGSYLQMNEAISARGRVPPDFREACPRTPQPRLHAAQPSATFTSGGAHATPSLVKGPQCTLVLGRQPPSAPSRSPER